MARRPRRVIAACILSAHTLVGALGCSDDDSDPAAACTRTTPDGWSVARTWNEALLGAIRLDFPSPTVHARNLFHTSAAMWDAWAAYDADARGVFVDESAEAADVGAAREEAISHAAYGILVERYLLSPGAEESVTAFDELMDDLCYDRTVTDTDGDSPAALGNRIASTILADHLDDGSYEADEYLDPDYAPVNPPLLVAESGTEMADPNRWQPLELEVMVSQTGIPLEETVQTFVGSQWGSVTPFAIGPGTGGQPALDPGPPPLLGDPDTDAEFKEAVAEVVRHSATLDPDDTTMIDIGPASTGNAALASYDEGGHDVNPVTGRPYEPNLVPGADYGRVVAEFWADGPSSETPPGHWNTIANTVTDALGDQLRVGGAGPVVDALEWDVKLYLALNGAMHDSAIAAWGAKAHYDYARPISMIRYMGQLGQSSDPDGPSHHPDGLPLVDGSIEVITAESAAPGERHAHLASHLGEMAVRAWNGTPDDPESGVAGVGWIAAANWVPYQLPTFVTPAFAAYISGHSTFSRAAAEILGAATGSPFFPGGLGEWTIPADSLEFEAGPDSPITLQWATFADAADEAGRSRLYGGIHVRADDVRGREVGYAVGLAAWEHAAGYFDGSVD